VDNKKKFSIVVPCYNERKNIPFVLDKFAKIIDRNDIEIIFVDNGSVDGSSEVLNELLPKYLFAETIRLEVNQGYGFGILSGLKRAKGEFLGWVHGDMQTDPMDVIKAIEIIERSNNKNIFVKGERKGRALFDQIFTIGMSFFETFLLRTFLWDINAQPNIFNRKLFESWKNPPCDFSLDLFALYSAKKQGYEIKRFFVTFPKRIYGMSHWNTGIFAKWKFIKRTLSFSFKLIFNPKNIN
jgi:glycosyltransferase involved in cell wall biosynthesis